MVFPVFFFPASSARSDSLTAGEARSGSFASPSFRLATYLVLPEVLQEENPRRFISSLHHSPALLLLLNPTQPYSRWPLPARLPTALVSLPTSSSASNSRPLFLDHVPHLLPPSPAALTLTATSSASPRTTLLRSTELLPLSSPVRNSLSRGIALLRS